MYVQEYIRGEDRVLAIEGQIDSSTSVDLEKKLTDLLSAGEKQLILDFKNVDYISSAGLRVIVKVMKEINRVQGNMCICSVKDYIMEVFEVSGLSSFFTIVP
jgi:anti-sigma B factor antagonist